MNVKKMFPSEILFSLLQTCVITGLVLFCVSPFSCKCTEEGIILVNENNSCPKIQDFSTTGERSARIIFNQKVNFKEYSVFPELPVQSLEVDGEETCIANLFFSDSLEIGKEYRFFGIVSDRIGNTLTFSLPLVGYNGQVPSLEITEVHTKYSSGSNSSGKYYKCEYVEIRATSAGNLSGLELYSSCDGPEKTFVFPAVAVKSGDVIVVHLRKKEDSAVSELGEELNLSKAKYSSDSARDLWAENENARLGDETDIVLLKNSGTGEILDAVCYASETALAWKNDSMTEDAGKAVAAGVWEGADVACSVRTGGMTATKSLEKYRSGKGASCWRVTGTSGETPGTVCF